MSPRAERLLYPPPSRVTALIAVALTVALAVLACARASDEARPGGADRRRIVTVGGAITETVFALGAGDRVVGVDTSSVFPPSAGELPRIGYQRTLSAEGILALEPDLVLAAAEAGPPATLDQLRAAGVRIELMAPAETVAAAADRIRAIGAVIGARAGGDALADRVRSSADTAANTARARGARPRVLFLYARGAGTLMVSGNATAPAAMIALAGGDNAITAWDGYRPLSAEAALMAAPDVILVPARGLESLGGIDGVLAQPGLGETPAGRNRRVVALDDLLLLGFGPRLPEAITALSTALGPT